MNRKDKTLKKINKKTFFVLFVLFFIVLIAFNFLFKQEEPKNKIKISENNPSWNTYVNKDYGFSIDFPVDWKVYEDSKTVSPTINIYLPKKGINPPFDHFAEINNVSIFPKGLPTEAVIGQFQPTEIELDFKSDKAVDYVLEDGTAWATYISLDRNSEPWKPWGFIWSKIIIENVGYKCFDGKKEIDLDFCNPFEGDEFIRNGQTDKEIREIEKEIIKSLKFDTI